MTMERSKEELERLARDVIALNTPDTPRANSHCAAPTGSHPKPLMKKYTIETGKFGQYFRDNEAKRDIPLEEVAALLNGEATEQAEESGYSKARRHEEDNLQWQRDNRA